MDKKMEVFSKVQFTGGVGGISQAPKSGLLYKEIMKNWLKFKNNYSILTLQM